MEFFLFLFGRDVLGKGATGSARPPHNLWEWQAAQMRNYMLYLIDQHGFKPKYYCPRDPENSISILCHHI